jgi:hypothetical protein
MISNREKLHNIGLRYGTDKSTYHQFTPFYERYFESIRDKNLKILEIGVYNGASIKMLEEYFQNSIIYGVDIEDKKFMEADRIKILKFNQESLEDLSKFPKDLDIIIDDGGHTMFQQQLSFKILFQNNLKQGGYYIIEDLHTSYPKYYRDYGSNERNNTLRLLNDLNYGELSEGSDYFINEQEFDDLRKNIKNIEIHTHKSESDNSTTSMIVKI